MTVNGRTGLTALTILTASSNQANSLQGIQTTGLQQGSMCFVAENNGEYMLFPSDAQVPDNVNIVAAVGGGNWILQNTGSVTPGDYALTRMIWVDGESAVATETGTPSSPFKTIQQAIDVTDDTFSWQINIMPDEYACTDLVIPANRRIKFVGMGNGENVVQGAAAFDTEIYLVTPLTIYLSSPDINTPSEIQFENLTIRNSNIDFDDSAVTHSAPHMLLFRRCFVPVWILGENLATAATVLNVLFEGDNTETDLSNYPRTSYVGRVTGPAAATPQVNVIGSRYVFSDGIIGVTKVCLDSCRLILALSVYGTVAQPSRFTNTVVSCDPRSFNGANFQADAFSNYYLTQNGVNIDEGSVVLISDPSFAIQTEWYVDTASGADANSGLSGAPLRSFAELQRRWGVRPHFTAAVTITVTGDVDEDVALRADVSGDGVVNLVGVPTTLVASDTISSDQSWDYSTGANGQDAQVVGTAITDWGPYVANNGANPASRLWRSADSAFGFVLGTVDVPDPGTIARPTRMGVLGATPGPSLTMSDLATADVVAVQQLPTIRSLLLDIQRLDAQPATVPQTATVQNVRIYNDSSGLPKITVLGAERNSLQYGVVFVGCILSGVVHGNNSTASFLNCVFRGVENMSGTAVGGGANEELVVNNAVLRCSDTIAIVEAFVTVQYNSLMTAVSLAIFDSAVDGIAIDRSQVVVDEIYGSGNGAYGIDVVGSLYYGNGNVPKTTGTSGDNLIGGAAIANGALPNINANNNSMVVVDP